MDERNRKLNIFNASDCCSNRHSSQQRNSQNLNESPIEREIDIQNSQLMDNIDDAEIYRLISEDRNDQLNDQPRLPNANLSDNVLNRITSNLIELNENSSHLVLHDTVNISNNNIVNSVRDLLNEHQQVIQRQNAELLENMTQTARAIGNNANAVNNVVTEEINNRAGF